MIRSLSLVAPALTLLTAHAASAQEVGMAPAYGSVHLAAGEEHSVIIKAGGSENLAARFRNCVGFVAEPPDFAVVYTAGEAPLVFLVHSEADTTLLVNFPDGLSWACDDDGGLNGRDPGLVIHDAPSGQYDVWVGTKEVAAAPEATLRITDSAVD